MRTTKFVLLLLAVLLPSLATAQVSTLTAFSSKAFAKATTREDTSATLTIGAYPYVCYQMTSTGTDSAALSVAVDAFINGVWVNTVTAAHTFQLGRPAGHIIAGTGKGQVDYVLLRTPATTTIDILGGASVIRFRNKFSAGAGDSTSATSYTQKVILRKP
jgi:hypothetical protein